jgi:hypothetical protein
MPLHTFHIPVMGLAYTVDSPIKVARFGISSVISIVEDRLTEMMRRHYYPTIGQTYYPINTNEEDYRAKRIADYLNLVNTIVQDQVEKLRNAAFEAGSEIVKYFEMLPDESPVKRMYQQMMQTETPTEQEKIAAYLRSQIKPGCIDVNIMTKTDRNNYDKNGDVIPDGSDAVSALRGYANSDLNNSSVIFSAGMNPRVYNYLEQCSAFDMDENGRFSKKVVIKVSDYRSALIQGKYLAKKGIWVSEFRVESGLNCGGHAFATDGYLLGPILEEFKANREELVKAIFDLYNAAQEKKSGRKLTNPPEMILTVQGGIGTHEEDAFLRERYEVNSTGWGTPFLLVPEATTVDPKTLGLLSNATEKDIVLSRNSPFGIRFHYLKGTTSEKEKLLRIENQNPGSPCTEKHLSFNTEFTTEPICTASQRYQKYKIAQLQSMNLSEEEYQHQLSDVLAKECLCVGLSNAAAINYSETFVKKLDAVTICPGPNITNFSKVVSLQTMIDHIYGRANVLTNPNRPHMFIAELKLYLQYLREQLEDDKRTDQLTKKKKYYTGFFNNLKNGIAYYENMADVLSAQNQRFRSDLAEADKTLDMLNEQYEMVALV